MAEVGATNIKKRAGFGDQIKVTATLTNISDNETFTVPHLRTIEDWSWAPTSAAGDGLKVVVSSGNVMTLTTVTTGSQDGIITVYGR